MPREFVTVTRGHPCPICGKPDWCGVSSDGELAVCMRVDNGRSARNGGWIHVIAEKREKWTPPPKPRRPDPPANFLGLMNDWMAATRLEQVYELAADLGVTTESIVYLGAAWADPHKAWAFPMRSPDMRLIGVRLRSGDGRKWAVRGSRAGLFISIVERPAGPLVVCEGPTDTAAAMTLGFHAVGRPSCLGNEAEVAEYARIGGVKDVVICADRDAPGQRGAAKLAEALGGFRVWTVTPPFAKDIREFVKSGGRADAIHNIIRNQIPKVRR